MSEPSSTVMLTSSCGWQARQQAGRDVEVPTFKQHHARGGQLAAHPPSPATIYPRPARPAPLARRAPPSLPDGATHLNVRQLAGNILLNQVHQFRSNLHTCWAAAHLQGSSRQRARASGLACKCQPELPTAGKRPCNSARLKWQASDISQT